MCWVRPLLRLKARRQLPGREVHQRAMVRMQQCLPELGLQWQCRWCSTIGHVKSQLPRSPDRPDFAVEAQCTLHCAGTTSIAIEFGDLTEYISNLISARLRFHSGQAVYKFISARIRFRPGSYALLWGHTACLLIFGAVRVAAPGEEVVLTWSSARMRSSWVCWCAGRSLSMLKARTQSHRSPAAAGSPCPCPLQRPCPQSQGLYFKHRTTFSP